MLIAAHPDDESLACSVLLQRAVRAGADIQVVYATDGENNQWPQRVLQRKWRLNQSDHERWGKLRRCEALSALAVLSVADSSAIFLALPDQRLTQVLLFDARRVLDRLAGIIADWRPTHLFAPSISDTHPDHNALGVMLRLVWAQYFSEEAKMSMWSYSVHGTGAAFFDRAAAIGQTAIETAVKLRAISCHKTQLKLSRRRFLDHARQSERFIRLGPRETTDADGMVFSVARGPRSLWIEISRPLRLMRSRRAALFVLGRDISGKVRCGRTQGAVESSQIEISDAATNERLAAAHYVGGASAGTLAIPTDLFSPNDALFLKLERRGSFFDETGWFELPAIEYAEPVVADEFIAGRKVEEVAFAQD
jgi:LmbE family N-acetylglucosaminyl deacetylase